LPEVIRVLIADDEPVAREMSAIILAGDPRFAVAGEASNGLEAVRAIQDLSPDVVLLDIRMPGLDGFGVCEAIGVSRMPPVVFVTAHADQALRAFRVRALDYVVKPFDDERLKEALSHAHERIRTERAGRLAKRLSSLLHGASPEDAPAPVRLLVPTKHGHSFLDTRRIDYITADRNYARLHVGEDVRRLKRSLVRLERALGSRDFIRIHRSTIVNVNRIMEIQPWIGGDSIAILTTGKRLRVSRGFRDRLMSRRL